MPYRVINMMITDVMNSVTDATISMIQSANEPVKKQLIDRYCGRLSTWEASWLSVLTEGQVIPAAYDAHHDCLSPAPMLSAPLPASASKNTPDKTSDSHRRSVSAINKVLERYNLMRKQRLH
jgi:hypothetical protein